MATTRHGPARGRLARLGWFAGIWLASVCALAVFAWLIRLLIA